MNNEVCSFLITKIYKYDSTKGKAFSYFGTIAKRYLILHNNKNFNDRKKTKSFDCLEDCQKEHVLYEDYSKHVLVAEDREEISRHYNIIIGQLIDRITIDKNIICKKDKDFKIFDGIIKILQDKDSIDEYSGLSKSSIYILLREYSRENSTNITSVLKKIKKYYLRIYKEYWDNIPQGDKYWEA